MNTASVKYKSHYKLHVPFRDKIIFESELANRGIDFYFDENQPGINVSVKYFLKESDSRQVDDIIRKNEIIASLETQVVDYIQHQKIQKLYLGIALATTAIFLAVLVVVFQVSVITASAKKNRHKCLDIVR